MSMVFTNTPKGKSSTAELREMRQKYLSLAQVVGTMLAQQPINTETANKSNEGGKQ